MNETTQSIGYDVHIQRSNPAVSPEVLAFGSKSGAIRDVLKDRQLTLDDKRAILASWASDAHAVADMPALRRIGDGKVVTVDDILDALKSIDSDEHTSAGIRTVSYRRSPVARREPRIRLRWLSRIARRKNSDDDDPPPCPAAVSVPGRPRLVDARAPMPTGTPAMQCAVLAAA
jgi:hypothetical protein